MRSIYLVSRAKMTGPINQGLNILNGMKQNGRVQSTLVTLAPEDPQKSWLYRFKEIGLDIVQFNQPLWKSLCAIPKLRKYINEQHVDVIHSCGYRANFIALMAHTGAKIVITQRCHPSEAVEKFPKAIQPIFNAFYLWMIKRMDAIVACSKSIQSILKNEYYMDVECVQNGVNTDFFLPPSENQKKNLRRELGLPLDKRVYLVLGSLRYRKNNSLIIDAMNKLNQDNIVIVFVGNGPEENMLKEKSSSNESIIFAGLTKTPLKYLQSADVLVSASLAEGLPNTVLEALSCGLPCILSDIDPHKELIEGTEAGIIFKRHSVEELCGCILDSCQWNMITKSHKAREIAIENYGVCSLAEKYEKIYRNVLNDVV